MRNRLTPHYLLVIIIMFVTTACAQVNNSKDNTSTGTPTLSEYIFTPSSDVSSQVQQTLALAKAQNKQALFVLGAQWCHDSRGLAKQFSTPQMQTILAANYQVLFVDTGYLNKGFDVVEQFNLPIYYGTPTVMVVDPNTRHITNRDNMQKWLSADKVPLHEYEEYFTAFAKNDYHPAKVSQAMQVYLNTIDNFEKQQAVRLKAAYDIVGPLLAQYKEGKNKDESAEFFDKWEQVYNLRSRIPDDIQLLIKEAKSNVAAGSSASLTLPIYPEFSWD